ncbi:hypothetical protein ACA910_014365 [Epithemia clementina (nom. ined.)]
MFKGFTPFVAIIVALLGRYQVKADEHLCEMVSVVDPSDPVVCPKGLEAKVKAQLDVINKCVLAKLAAGGARNLRGNDQEQQDDRDLYHCPLCQNAYYWWCTPHCGMRRRALVASSNIKASVELDSQVSKEERHAVGRELLDPHFFDWATMEMEMVDNKSCIPTGLGTALTTCLQSSVTAATSACSA